MEQLHKATITSSSSNHSNNKQTCLPRTQLTALVVRTREALRLASALPPPLPEEVGALVAAAEEGLTTLGKVFRVYDGDVGDAEASLGVAAAVAAAVGGGGGGGGLGGVVVGGGGGGFRFG